MKKNKVLILVMPLADPHFIGLGPALIRSILLQNAIECDIFYANLVFSRIVQGDHLVESQLVNLAQGELIFAPYYFGTPKKQSIDLLQTFVSGLAKKPEEITEQRFSDLLDKAGEFLDEIFNAIHWEEYDVIGFSVLMQQTIASLALAKKIKGKYPDSKILFGGPNVANPMGEEVIRSFPEVDYVIEGEADAIIVEAINEIIEKSDNSFKTPGILYRSPEGDLLRSGSVEPFFDLDKLPIPDYQPYFKQLEINKLNYIQPTLPLESSRGCWWGERNHCSFCGMDDHFLKFRTKSSDRIVSEVLNVSAKYRYNDIFFVDNIIDYKYNKTLLPVLSYLIEEEEYDINYFFESKSNLNRRSIREFKNSGINTVQPGLENFSDNLLGIMNKGVTGIRQVQTLKFMAEQNMNVNWNLIYRIPGETVQDYLEQIELLEYIHHLPPLHPTGFIPMQINRYAPNFINPEKYGIKRIEPRKHYFEIFQKKEIQIDSLAYYFDYERIEDSAENLQDLYIKLDESLQLWRDCYSMDSLVQERGPGFVKIIDQRNIIDNNKIIKQDKKIEIYEGIYSDIFSFLDSVKSFNSIQKEFGGNIGVSDLHKFLEELVQRKFVYRNKLEQYLNLPLLLTLRA